MITIRCGNVTFPNIHAIIFDKDGTLEDSQDYLRHLAIKRSRLIDAQIPGIGEPLLMAFGMEANNLNPKGLMAVGSRKENEIAAAAYIAETGRDWIESLAIAQNAFTEADLYLKEAPASPLFVGSLDVLQNLSSVGLKLAILSAATTKSVEKFINTHQLQDYIQIGIGVDSGPSKPDPILFTQTCQKLGVDPAHTLMIGDSMSDIEMSRNAKAAGCIGICWHNHQANHLQSADVVISDLAEISVIRDAR